MDAQVGAITVVQRSDSALRLNVHFHTLAADGVWVRDPDGEPRFRELPPTAEDVAEVASRTHQKLMRVLARHGRELEGIDDALDTGNAKSRAEVVPSRLPEAGEQLALLDEDQGGPAEAKRSRRHQWAWLLSGVFGVDIIECPRCGGRLRVVEVVSEPAHIAHALHERVARARPPELLGQFVLDFALRRLRVRAGSCVIRP